MVLRRLIFVKSELNAGNVVPAEKLFQARLIRFPVARAVRSEQHDAIAGAPLVIAITPAAVGIEIDDGIDPTGTIQVRPLIGEAEMRLYDFAAYGLEIHASRITF